MNGPPFHMHIDPDSGLATPLAYPSEIWDCPICAPKYQHPDALATLADLNDCWCSACDAMLGGYGGVTRMIVCPDCGCKRCPKATNHLHTCTGSNDSGQVGSSYGVPCEQECCRGYNEYVEECRQSFARLIGEGNGDQG